MAMVKRSDPVPAHRQASGATAIAAPAATPRDDLQHTFTLEARRAVARHIATALLPGPPDRAMDAWLSMFTAVLRLFCRATSYNEDPIYLSDAAARIPRMACILLRAELQLRKLDPVELRIVSDALGLVEHRRGKHGTGTLGEILPGSPMPTPPPPWPSCVADLLGYRMHVAAIQAVALWEGSPPDEQASTDLYRLWLEFGDRVGINRKQEWKDWHARLETAGRYCTEEMFLEAACITRSPFYEGWLGLANRPGKWPDDHPSAKNVLEVLSRPISSWPLKPTR